MIEGLQNKPQNINKRLLASYKSESNNWKEEKMMKEIRNGNPLIIQRYREALVVQGNCDGGLEENVLSS